MVLASADGRCSPKHQDDTMLTTVIYGIALLLKLSWLCKVVGWKNLELTYKVLLVLWKRSRT